MQGISRFSPHLMAAISGCVILLLAGCIMLYGGDTPSQDTCDSPSEDVAALEDYRLLDLGAMFTDKATSGTDMDEAVSQFPIGQGLSYDAAIVDWGQRGLDRGHVIAALSEIYASSIPIIVIDPTVELLSDEALGFPMIAMPERCDLFGAYLDTDGHQVQYMTSGYDPEESMDRVERWISDVTAVSQGRGSDSSDAESGQTYWRDLGFSRIDYSLGDRGDFSISYGLSKLINQPMTDRDFFILHYVQNGAPNTEDGYRLSSIGLETLSNYEDRMMLIDTAPGSTSMSASVSFSGGSGFESGSSASWSYSIPDVVVLNQSNHSKNKANISHEINESALVGLGYTAEPGIEFALMGGAGIIIDQHTVTTCEKKSGSWNSTYYENYITNNFIVSLYVPGGDHFLIGE